MSAAEKLCTFCWPRIMAASIVDAATRLPCCAACAARQDRRPTMPRFLWPFQRDELPDPLAFEHVQPHTLRAAA